MGKRRARGLLVGVLLGLCGCSHQDADRLARVSRRAAGKLESATGGAAGRLTDGWQAVWAGWDEIDLNARVAARLRWDKALAGAHVDVHASGGTVELTGTVTDANQRARAIELAQATVGVEHVTDKLEISAEQP